MEQRNNALPFDAKTVELNGTNLIEASAGTGKTYSIAILALRLILEMNIPLKKILMVTFTKAAVAELHERIRLFIKLAYRSALGDDISDETIQSLVRVAIEMNGQDETRQRLYDAVLLLDELSVITIHSFCQQTLTEFAFETKQLFGAEMFTELEEVITQEVNHFWRKHVTVLDADLLASLGIDTLRSDLVSIVKDHMEGKRYAPYNNEHHYHIQDVSMEAYENYQTFLQKESFSIEERVLLSIQQNKDEIAERWNATKSPKKKAFIACLEDGKSLIGLLNSVLDEGKKSVLIDALPEAFLHGFLASKRALDQVAEKSNYFLAERLNCLAIQVVSEKVKSFLVKNNFLGYNDLIQNLHRSLTVTPNPSLVQALQSKYKAVFVDEFQDTDKEQYEIFRTAFFTNTILFLIGDPKQSIYAWRKADIHTYFKARNDVDKEYEMNVNFRSSASLIAAMNQFFLPQSGFNTFAFPAQEDSIRYTPVKSPENSKKGRLLYNGIADIAISVFEASKKEVLIQNVSVLIQALLTDPGYSIEAGGIQRKVVPSDIGILVRRNMDGVGVKNYLGQIGIPAVMINDEKIFESQEAKELLYLLEAIFEPNLSSIHKALLNTITGFTIDDLLKLDEEKVLDYFQRYKSIWQRNGVYPALQRFLKDFGLKQRLIGHHEIQGERVLSNLIQLIELLNQTVHYGALSQEELLAWFKRGVNGMAIQGDEYIARMESDEDAVKIVTIHKSKGLEYNIVLAPFLDMNVENKFDFQRFREEDGSYIVRETSLMTEGQMQMNLQQLEQENRRLIYVAVTRGVFKCFLFENKASYYSKSSLKPFVNAITGDSHLIYKGEMPHYDLHQYQALQHDTENHSLVASHFNLVSEHWMKLSYSAMSIHPAKVYKERTDKMDDAYDRFVFNQLKFGAAAGNLLHQILEQIDFSNDTRWPQEIEHALKAYMPGRIEAFSPLLKQLLEYVVQVPIAIGKITFSLKDVIAEKRIAELEFDFPIEGLQTKLLEHIVNNYNQVFIRSFEGTALEGLMNGKIDLFFEHKGRFYILDWKSNYLGYKAEDYDEAGVLNAMNENNYHLQYLIYTVALKKYLTTRIPDFDYDKQFGGVIYLFLRGLRKDSTTGVFTARPPLMMIERMEQLLHKNALV